MKTSVSRKGNLWKDLIERFLGTDNSKWESAYS